MFRDTTPSPGILLRDCRHAEFKDLKCMNFTSKGTREILVAGCQDKMFKVDVDKGTVTDTVRK
jgi:hypothetical protein